MNRVLVLVGVAVLLVIGVLALPIKQRCGAPGFSCATAPDAHGNISYYFEMEPLGVKLIESLTGSNFPLYYTSGHELVKVP
jgi:hypothetical protein